MAKEKVNLSGTVERLEVAPYRMQDALQEVMVGRPAFK